MGTSDPVTCPTCATLDAPDYRRALVAQGRAHDQAMTPPPWVEPEGGRMRGAVEAVVGGYRRQVVQASSDAPSAEDLLDVGPGTPGTDDVARRRLLANASGVAWIRTHLAALLDQVDRALDLADEEREAREIFAARVAEALEGTPEPELSRSPDLLILRLKDSPNRGSARSAGLLLTTRETPRRRPRPLLRQR